MTTSTPPRPGTDAWTRRIKANLAEKYGIDNADDVRLKSLDGHFKAEGSADRFTSTISNPTVDSDREVLLPDGMVSTRFDQNGAGFYMHDYSRPPIFVPTGKVQRSGDNLVSSARWLSASPLAREVREFVEVMNEEGKSAGVSVGAIYLETRRPTAKDKSRFGENVELVVSKWDLLEWSIAPIQANPDAMVSRIGKAAVKSLFPGWGEPPIEPLDLGVDTTGLYGKARDLRRLRSAYMDAQAKRAARLARERKELLELAALAAEGRRRGLIYV